MVKVPIDELPVEAIIVGDKYQAIFDIFFHPIIELCHYYRWFIELKNFIPCKSTYVKCTPKSNYQKSVLVFP